MKLEEYEQAVLWLQERHLEVTLPEYSSLVRGALVGECIVTDWVSFSSSPWFVGPYGAMLDQIKAYSEPIPCKGKLGIWDIPNEIRALIAQQQERLR